jgi:hypothetical protein
MGMLEARHYCELGFFFISMEKVNKVSIFVAQLHGGL